MSAVTATSRTSPAIWGGRVMSGFVVLFLLFDAAIHLARPEPVVAAFAELGYPIGLSIGLGIAELVCTLLYVIPASSVLGAILLTGYLGGAVATHLRVGNPPFEAYIFPALVGALIWGGLYLRDARLRALVPLRRPG
jgi:hypothetical protein